MRAPSRSMNHASRFPVSFAEFVRAPQYLRGERQQTFREFTDGRRFAFRQITTQQDCHVRECTSGEQTHVKRKKNAYTGRVIHISAMIKTVARPTIRKYSLRAGASPGEKTIPKADRPQMSMLPKNG